MMPSEVALDHQLGKPYMSMLSWPGEGCVTDISSIHSLGRLSPKMFPAEKQPTKGESLVTREDEGFVVGQSSLPELKRAASVPIPVRPMAAKYSTGPAKPVFKIELPSIHSFGTPLFLRDLKSSPTISEIAMNGHVSTLSNPRHYSCATEDPAKSLSTPPPEGFLPCKMASANKGCRDTAVGKGSGGSIDQVQGQPIDSESPESTDPGSASNMPESQPAADANEGADTTTSPPRGVFVGTGRAGSYLDKAIEVVLSEIPNEESYGNAIRVLSHALPCPAAESHGGPPNTAYSTLIAAIQTKLESHQSSFISVIHAVPSRFSLANLPTSPPGTPNSSIGPGVNSTIPEDYFNMRGVFSSAVPVANHHELYGPATNTPVPSSPCLAVPPASISIAILERLIPPSNVQESFDLFAQTGPSVLLNRLIELSPRKGTLVFIYPTKAGSTTFASRYLGPILDPVLRTMINSHSLSADIAVDLGRIDAVEHLLSYEGMKRKINMLLEKLNRGSNPSNGLNYSLVYSSKESVHIDRHVWAEWFLQQETPRFRHVTTRYFQRARRLPEQPHVNYAVLTREIVEGITERKYNVGEQPGIEDGIEVGVYVVRRGA